MPCIRPLNCPLTIRRALFCALQMAYMYFTMFMHTMRREWFSIDRLRLDKFLMLVRKFMGQLFTYLRSHNW